MLKTILFSLIVSGCAADLSPGCDSDFECKEGRVCEAGACVDRSMPKPQEQPKACGETLVECNCNYTSHYNGEIVEHSGCQSGYVKVQACNFPCSQVSLAWGAVCTC